RAETRRPACPGSLCFRLDVANANANVRLCGRGWGTTVAIFNGPAATKIPKQLSPAKRRKKSGQGADTTFSRTFFNKVIFFSHGFPPQLDEVFVRIHIFKKVSPPPCP
ncbi:hypothetical protein AMECASPLE_031842, partial [Ameca splendens]